VHMAAFSLRPHTALKREREDREREASSFPLLLEALIPAQPPTPMTSSVPDCSLTLEGALLHLNSVGSQLSR
jgi:hypothetical protein